ncbi:MAG TPA: outer membrane beta-barrel protein, partial [Pontiella sp.]
ERLSFEITEHVRYQPKEGPSELNEAEDDQQFIENSLKGAANYVLNPQSYLMLGAGYQMRIWDDDDYGKGDRNNNYDELQANGSFVRQLNAEVTQGILGVNYADLEYEGDRGGYESVTVFTGVDHLFNPDLTGYARAGASFVDVESETGEADSTSPYFDAGLTLNPEGRTSIDIIGSLGYQAYRSNNSLYNIQNRLNVGTSIRHDLTAKITVAAAVSFIKGFYESDFATGEDTLPDAEDNYVSFNVRCSYQVNRNNFVELGYEYEDRSSVVNEWDRSRIEAGWRVRL